MNIIDLFAKGGKTKAKAEHEKDAILNVLQSIGIQSEVANNVLIQLAQNNDVKTANKIAEAVDTILNSESQEDRYTAESILKSIFMEESQIFKCGGKLQQLTAKFGKGGGVDCGCGGIKLQPGGQAPIVLEGSTPVRSAALAGLRTVRVPNVGPATRRRIGAVRDNEGGLHLFEDAVVNGNSAQTAVTIHPGDTVINQSVLRRSGWDPRKYVYGDDQYEAIMKRMRPYVNGVPYKQDGGELEYEALPGYPVDARLTRREAREIAKENKGFNGEQFSYAMANAMNAARSMGLRGQEARQRALQMVSGVTPTERSIVDVPTTLNVSAPILNTPATILEQPLQRETTNVRIEQPASVKKTSATKEPKSLADNLNVLFNKKQPVVTVGPIKENFTVETPVNQPSVVTASEETNNSGYYRPSDEELERRRQRWNNYWNRPINRPQYQEIDETYEATPGYAKTDYASRVNDYLNRPASNWGYQATDESQNVSGYYNGSMSNSDSNARRAERQLAKAKRAEINAFNQWNTWHGVNGVAETALPTYKYGTVQLTDEGYRYIPNQKCGGKVEKGQLGISIIHPEIVQRQYQKIEDTLTPSKRYEQEHGVKVVGGLGLPALVAPFTVGPAVARIPAEASLNQRGISLIRAEAEKQKAINAATKAGKFYVEPKPSDLDIDKLQMINNNFDKTKLFEYLKNTKFIK